MRKIAALFLATIIVCLSACTQPATSPSPTLSPVPKPTVTISTAGGQQVFLPNGSLPKTSYEAAALPKRFYDDVKTTLVPSDEYGHIWPYIGAYYEVNMMGDLVYSPVYGFCDGDGHIICEPVYTRVETLIKDGAKLYKASIFNRNDAKKKVSKITLVRPNGTWVKEYDEICIESTPEELSAPPGKAKNTVVLRWRNIITTDYIAVRKGDSWGVVDYNGNELLPCIYKKPLLFSEGLASVLSEDEKLVYFIDSSGSTVLGPYQAQPSLNNYYSDEYASDELVFSEGRARYYKDGKFGVIDKSGNVVIEAKYDYVTSYSEGTAVFISDGKYGIIGLNGEVLLEPMDKSFSNSGNGIIRYYENGANQSLNIYTGERKPYSYKDEKSYSFNKNVLSLKTKQGDKSISNVENVRDLKNGNLAISIKGDNPTWKIISLEGDTVAGPFKGQVSYVDSDDFIQVNLELCETSKEWYPYWKTIYDKTGKRLIPGYFLSITPFDGRFLVRDDTDAGLLDENGRWALKVPLYEFMGD